MCDFDCRSRIPTGLSSIFVAELGYHARCKSQNREMGPPPGRTNRWAEKLPASVFLPKGTLAAAPPSEKGGKGASVSAMVVDHSGSPVTPEFPAAGKGKGKSTIGPRLGPIAETAPTSGDVRKKSGDVRNILKPPPPAGPKPRS